MILIAANLIKVNKKNKLKSNLEKKWKTRRYESLKLIDVVIVKQRETFAESTISR